jgi:hypothetical protein
MLIHADAIFQKNQDFFPIGPAKGAWSAAVSHGAGERGLRIMAAAGEEKGKRTMELLNDRPMTTKFAAIIPQLHDFTPWL